MIHDVSVWKDVEIVFPSEDHKLLNCIQNVPSKVTNAYNLFYTLFNEETSERVLNLTTELLTYNESNYTVWYARRKCLESLGNQDSAAMDKRERFLSELAFVRQHCIESPKSYQVWYHRRWVIAQLDYTADELEVVERELISDSKNMNLWEHRKYLVDLCCQNASYCTNNSCDGSACVEHDGIRRQRCSCWFGREMAFSVRMIELDFRNNSAWSFRRVSVNLRVAALQSNDRTNDADDVVAAEIVYTINHCLKTPHNEPSWNVLRSYFYTEGSIRELLVGPALKSSSSSSSSRSLPLYSWTCPRFVSEIRHLVDTALQNDANNRFALYVRYLLELSNCDGNVCSQVLTHLADVDILRRHYWLDRIERLPAVSLRTLESS